MSKKKIRGVAHVYRPSMLVSYTSRQPDFVGHWSTKAIFRSTDPRTHPLNDKSNGYNVLLKRFMHKSNVDKLTGLAKKAAHRRTRESIHPYLVSDAMYTHWNRLVEGHSGNSQVLDTPLYFSPSDAPDMSLPQLNNRVVNAISQASSAQARANTAYYKDHVCVAKAKLYKRPKIISGRYTNAVVLQHGSHM